MPLTIFDKTPAEQPGVIPIPFSEIIAMDQMKEAKRQKSRNTVLKALDKDFKVLPKDQYIVDRYHQKVEDYYVNEIQDKPFQQDQDFRTAKVIREAASDPGLQKALISYGNYQSGLKQEEKIKSEKKYTTSISHSFYKQVDTYEGAESDTNNIINNPYMEPYSDVSQYILDKASEITKEGYLGFKGTGYGFNEKEGFIVSRSGETVSGREIKDLLLSLKIQNTPEGRQLMRDAEEKADLKPLTDEELFEINTEIAKSKNISLEELSDKDKYTREDSVEYYYAQDLSERFNAAIGAKAFNIPKVGIKGDPVALKKEEGLEETFVVPVTKTVPGSPYRSPGNLTNAITELNTELKNITKKEKDFYVEHDITKLIFETGKPGIYQTELNNFDLEKQETIRRIGAVEKYKNNMMNEAEISKGYFESSEFRNKDYKYGMTIGEALDFEEKFRRGQITDTKESAAIIFDDKIRIAEEKGKHDKANKLKEHKEKYINSAVEGYEAAIEKIYNKAKKDDPKLQKYLELLELNARDRTMDVGLVRFEKKDLNKTMETLAKIHLSDFDFATQEIIELRSNRSITSGEYDKFDSNKFVYAGYYYDKEIGDYKTVYKPTSKDGKSMSLIEIKAPGGFQEVLFKEGLISRLENQIFDQLSSLSDSGEGRIGFPRVTKEGKLTDESVTIKELTDIEREKLSRNPMYVMYVPTGDTVEQVPYKDDASLMAGYFEYYRSQLE